MFQSIDVATVQWRTLAVDGYQEAGLGHVELDGRAGLRAEGMVSGGLGGRPFVARFLLECDRHWRSRSLVVTTTVGRGLDIVSDGEGHWRSRDGKPLPALEGAIDLDLQASPLTNTLPTRRLGLTRSHGTVTLTMAYIPFDTFEPYADQQLYTCLRDGAVYRYENADGSFIAELPVDEMGLVIDYPQLFERIRN